MQTLPQRNKPVVKTKDNASYSQDMEENANAGTRRPLTDQYATECTIDMPTEMQTPAMLYLAVSPLLPLLPLPSSSLSRLLREVLMLLHPFWRPLVRRRSNPATTLSVGSDRR